MTNSPEFLKFKKPSTVVDQIYATLSRAIVNCDLTPGQRLKEEELQRSFGVSRAPIREALRLLEADGLVKVDAFKKKCVRRITHEDLKEIIPVMACLEGFAANLACEQLKEEQIDLLCKINKKMRDALTREDYELWAKSNFEFHSVFIKAAQNETLRRAIRSIVKSYMWILLARLMSQDNALAPMSINEHDNIIKLFREKDSKRVEEEVRMHVLNILKRFLTSSIFDSEGNYLFLSKN